MKWLNLAIKNGDQAAKNFLNDVLGSKGQF